MTDHPQDVEDDGKEILRLFVEHLKGRLRDKKHPVTAAEGAVILALLRDNSITISSVKAGKFGAYAKSVAEDFPFPDEGHTPTTPVN